MSGEWLDDDELLQRLNSKDPAGLAHALEMVEIRWSGGETLVGWLPTADALAPLAAVATYEQSDLIGRILLGEDRLYTPDSVAGRRDLGVLVAQRFPLESMHSVAMCLKIRSDVASSVVAVVRSVGEAILEAPASRDFPVSHFISCLRQGKSAVIVALDLGLATWGSVATARIADV